jgi:Flp pilus assembly protein TadD
LNRKQYDAARTQLLEAVERKPDEPTIYNNLALAQSNLGDKDTRSLLSAKKRRFRFRQ